MITLLKRISYQNIIPLVILKISFDLIYFIFFQKYFIYNGLFAYDFNLLKWIGSIVICIIISSYIVNHKKKDTSSEILIDLFNYGYFFPGLTLYPFMNLPTSYFIIFILYWYILLTFQYYLPSFTFIKPKENKYVFLFITVLTLLLAFYISGVYNHFKIHLDLTKVYEIRYQTSFANIPVIINYIRIWLVKIIPLLLTYYLFQKKKIISFILIVAQLLLYSIGCLKSSLFILIIVFSTYFIYDALKNKIPSFLAIFNFSLIAISLFFSKISVIILDYIQRRMLFLPNLLSYYYYDFFQTHEFDYLRQSILRHFNFISPYNININYLIGEKYFHNPKINAGNGLIGDAYRNFGILGCIIFPILIIISLRILDACCKKVDKKIVFVYCVALFNSFTNGAFFTTLLSDGFIVICLIFYFFPQKQFQSYRFTNLKLYKNKIKSFCKNLLAHILYYLPKPIAHKIFYYIIMKKRLNLEHPRDFNEKIQYLMVYHHSKLETTLADKLLVRDYIIKKGYESILPKLYGIYNNVLEIDFKKLPTEFVLKTNNGCGGVILCNNKNLLNIEKSKKILTNNLKTNFTKKSLEYHYEQIVPKIICEELIKDKNKKQPTDYKFYCFAGHVECILVCTDREKEVRLDYFDLNWNYLDYAKEKFRSHKKIPKPKNLEKMILIASQLSKDFKFVRVDLYNANGNIYFGELTFTPASGLIKYNTKEALEYLGSLISLKGV